jgi:hypothetical protein
MAKETPTAPEIDLKNIKNIDAVNTVEKDFEKVVVGPSKKKRSGKFDFTDTETIPLPSGGRLYESVTDDPDVLKGFIKMFPMGMKEEEILSTPRFLKSGSATRAILDRCIESNISAKDILMYDSNYLMYYLRKISYGDDYKFSITCSNSICERKFDHEVRISDLVFEELPEDMEEPIVVKLPKSGYTVKVILPRLYHSEELVLKDSNRKKTTEDTETRLVDNLLVTTVEILDFDGEEVPKRDWAEFFEALPGMDTATLRESTTFSTGVDELKGVMCPYCETEYSGSIPMGPEFFRF